MIPLPFLAQHWVPNLSTLALTCSQPCSDEGPRERGRQLAQPTPHVPMGQSCPPALRLKSIIQIILAWQHSSVAVMNSSEERRGRAHTLLITVADACFLPRPLPHTKTPTSTRISRDIMSPRCIITVDTAQLMGAQTDPVSPPQCTLLPVTPGCQDPKLQGALLSMVKMTPQKARPATALESGGKEEWWARVDGAVPNTIHPSFNSTKGPDPTFCWGKPPWARGMELPQAGTGLQITT